MKNIKRKSQKPTTAFVHTFDSLFRAPTPAAIALVAREEKTNKKRLH
jgi:hypothetical protein